MALDLSLVHDAVLNAKRELDRMKKTLAEIERRREDLRVLPPPREEIAAIVCREIDEQGALFPQCLAAMLKNLIHSPLDHLAPLILDDGTPSRLRILTATTDTTVMPTAKTLERAIEYIIPDLMKAGVRKAILHDMPYPENIAPPMRERLKELAAADKDLADLKTKIAAVTREFADIGLEKEPS